VGAWWKSDKLSPRATAAITPVAVFGLAGATALFADHVVVLLL
jgi:hypothetical protein